jgi:hypothetical protein
LKFCQNWENAFGTLCTRQSDLIHKFESYSL